MKHWLDMGRTFVALVAAVSLSASCGSKVDRRLTTPDRVETLDHESPYLKAHMKDGSVYILSEWKVDEQRRVVSGTGELWNLNRDDLQTGSFEVAVDSVALFETNVMVRSGVVAALAIISGLSLAVTTACLTNTKACFGSCPTFYIEGDEDQVLQAEGFSASIAPSLEATDIDALYGAHPKGPDVDIRMTNEAMETHVVRAVNLLAVKRPPGGRVFVDATGAFYPATAVHAPTACAGEEGSCIDDVVDFDKRMRSSTTDGVDLAHREVVDLSFDAGATGPQGLVIGARQSFLSTFLFYQVLAYMGHEAGHYLAALERDGVGDDSLEKMRGVRDLLGAVEVQLRDDSGAWKTIGEFDEVGPLASDVAVVPLPDGMAHDQVRLRLTRGHWRLDYLALADLGAKTTALRVRPSVARAPDGTDEHEKLLDPASHLTTGPGDAYHLHYDMPEDVGAELGSYELFLESRGYYLEWMRDEWMREESPLKAALVLSQPAAALRWLAPAFKDYEPKMEEVFWSSRYAKP